MSKQLDTASIKPYWQTTDEETVKLYHGDSLDVLSKLPEQSVHCVVTSPPYYGLRDYEIDGQLGVEETPRAYVDKLVEIFSRLFRVLHNSGTVWLNLGDSYAHNGLCGGGSPVDSRKPEYGRKGYTSDISLGRTTDTSKQKSMKYRVPNGLKPKDLLGIPWTVALAMRDIGFYLRQDIIWHKPSPMPESVTDRCIKAHEYIFLLTKSPRYFFDGEAIKEPATSKPSAFRNSARYIDQGFAPNNTSHTGNVWKGECDTSKRMKRSVWTVPSAPYKGAHFACFPPKLIEPCILAGTSEYGCCASCLNPYRRIIEKTKLYRERPNKYTKRTGEEGTGNSCANDVAGVKTTTTGWEKTCTCKTSVIIPCTVLDPFIGSGTTASVCVEKGRNCIGIDLSEKYLKNNAVVRIEGTLGRYGLHHLIPRPAPTRLIVGKKIVRPQS